MHIKMMLYLLALSRTLSLPLGSYYVWMSCLSPARSESLTERQYNHSQDGIYGPLVLH